MGTNGIRRTLAWMLSQMHIKLVEVVAEVAETIIEVLDFAALG